MFGIPSKKDELENRQFGFQVWPGQNNNGTTSHQPSKTLTNLTEQDLTGILRCHNPRQPNTRQALTLHIECLHLNITDYIKENMLGDIYVKITWKFINYKQSCNQKLSNNPLIVFASTNKYLLQVPKIFFERVKTEPLKLELSVFNESEELLLSSAAVYFTRQFESKEGFAVRFMGTAGSDETALIGKLSAWYELSDSASAALRKLDEREAEEAKKLIAGQSNNPSPVVSKNLRNTQSDSSNEIKKMLKKESQKVDWNHALHKKKREQVDEDKMSVKSLPIISVSKFNRLPRRNQKELPHLTINIKKLRLFPGSRLIKNEAISKIYVEYEFLGYSGPEMETPYSMAKPKENQWLDIDFVKAFPIHLVKNYEVCNAMAAMIKNHQSIKFSIVSEPVEDPRVNIQTCKEVGFAEVSLADLVEIEGINEYEQEYGVHDSANYSDGVVGVLVVRVVGIVALKKLALSLWLS